VRPSTSDTTIPFSVISNLEKTGSQYSRLGNEIDAMNTYLLANFNGKKNFSVLSPTSTSAAGGGVNSPQTNLNRAASPYEDVDPSDYLKKLEL